jgi:hypothetical protein
VSNSAWRTCRRIDAEFRATILGRIAPQRNGLGGISMLFFPRKSETNIVTTHLYAA